MCKGYFIRMQREDLKQMKMLRTLSWIIVCGYADPKKLPRNMQDWWPLDGDVQPKGIKMTKSFKNKIANAIKAELERGKKHE
jgi:hypothetical protein